MFKYFSEKLSLVYTTFCYILFLYLAPSKRSLIKVAYTNRDLFYSHLKYRIKNFTAAKEAPWSLMFHHYGKLENVEIQ